MLLDDFLKANIKLQDGQMYLEDDFLQMFEGARKLLNNIEYDLHPTKLKVKDAFLTPSHELADLLGLKASTLRNYRVEINQITEARLQKDFIRRLLECNKQSLLNKIEGKLVDADLEAKVQQLKDELQIATLKLDENFMLQELHPLIVETPESTYVIPDLTQEINFLTKYNRRQLDIEIQKVDIDKLRFIHAVLNGDIPNVNLSTSLAELITHREPEEGYDV